MEAKTHMRLGVAGALAASWLGQRTGLVDLATTEGQVTVAAIIVLVRECSLAPDLDMRGTTAARRLGPVGNAIATTVGDWAGAKYKRTRTQADRNKRNPEHRTASHTFRWWVFPMTLWAAVLTSMGASVGAWLGYWQLADAAYWTGVVAGSVFLGNVMHLVGDAVTVSGVPVFAGLFKIKGQYWYPIRLLPQAWCFRVGGEEDPARPGERKQFKAERHLWTPALLLIDIALFAALFPPGVAIGVAGVLALYFGHEFYRRMRRRIRRAIV